MTDQFHANCNRENREAFERACEEYCAQAFAPVPANLDELVRGPDGELMVHVTLGHNPRRSIRLVPS